MIRAFSLLLPVLMPSWRFFALVAPSPRIEYAFIHGAEGEAENWQAFRPIPNKIGFLETLERLVANSHWNDSLFLTSCAERYLQDGSRRHYDYIVRRLRDDLGATRTSRLTESHFQFRLVLVYREQDRIVQQEVHRSAILSLENTQGAP